jgi:hypothetical protein
MIQIDEADFPGVSRLLETMDMDRWVVQEQKGSNVVLTFPTHFSELEFKDELEFKSIPFQPL